MSDYDAFVARYAPDAKVAQGRVIVSEGSPSSGEVIAKPGDIVTCPDGHPVYEVLEPVLTGPAPSPTWFREIATGQHPGMGRVPPCPTCGCTVFPELYHPNDEEERYALFVDGKLASER